MVEIDPGLDTRLRAFFDHYEGEAMPPRLATFDEEAKPKRRLAVQFVAGALGVAVIASAAAVFGIELSSHRAVKPPASAVSPSSLARDLPPASEVTGLLPATRRIVVPITYGRGSASLPTFIPTGKISIEYACSGIGSFAFTSNTGEVGSSSPMCYANGADSSVEGITVPASPAIDGKPLSLSISTGSGITWEVVIADSASDDLPFTAPVGSKTLVPDTRGTGDITLPAFIPTEPFVYIDLYCTGGGSLVITAQPEQGAFPDPSSCLGASSVGEFGRDEFMSGPLSLSVNAPASSRWEILVYETNQFFEGASASPSAMPAAWGTFTAPPGAKTLVPATKGTGTVTLPTFTPTEWYYIVSACTGGGSMVISSQPAEGGPGESSCLSPGLNTGANDFVGPADEVMGEALRLTVAAPASSSWEILVYETNQPDGT